MFMTWKSSLEHICQIPLLLYKKFSNLYSNSHKFNGGLHGFIMKKLNVLNFFWRFMLERDCFWHVKCILDYFYGVL